MILIFIVVFTLTRMAKKVVEKQRQKKPVKKEAGLFTRGGQF
jgi:hypothetical protein